MKTLENPEMELNKKKIEKFAGQVMLDLSANMSGVMIMIGHELGLYKAMMGEGPITVSELSEKTDTFERYVQEWLNNQAAGGFVTYNPDDKTFELPMEHALVLASDDSPAYMTPGFYLVASMWHDKDQLAEAFKTGKGISWHEHHHDLFFGTEAFFKSGYRANLLDSWIPALEGVQKKLENGGRVADVGCGHGASTILMAERFPSSQFYGFDYHTESIEIAQKRALEAGVTNVQFLEFAADTYEEGNFDLICFMDAFHDFGNPLKAVSHARIKLASNGTVMMVEPAAGDKLEDNIHPLGRMFYAGSTAMCVPHSHSQQGGYCLGAQAGPARTREIMKEAGYSSFRIARQTSVNHIYEAKK